jgi:hypothetical protein
VTNNAGQPRIVFEHHDGRPIGHQSVGQEDVPGTKGVPQPAEQAGFALPLPGVPADPEVHNGPTSQGNDDAHARSGSSRPAADYRLAGRLLDSPGCQAW